MTAEADWKTVPGPPELIFHVGRRPDPFYWYTPLKLDPAQPAGSRFDDPHGEYATLYCAGTAYGALLEKLCPMRPIPEVAAQYASALDDEVDPEFDLPPTGRRFPASFVDENVMGTATLHHELQFVDVEDPRNHRMLETLGGAALLRHLEVGRIDRGTFATNRRVTTRRVARELYELVDERIAGLRYLSAIDGDVECWAIWDRVRHRLCDTDLEPFDLTSPALIDAANLLGFDLQLT
jgi:hypothetical protein